MHHQAQEQHPAQFYSSLVKLQPDVPSWSGKAGPPALTAPQGPPQAPPPAAPAAQLPGGNKPVLFRSAGVHDMSNLNLSTSSSSSQQHQPDGPPQRQGIRWRGPGPPAASRKQASLSAAETLIDSQWQAAQAAFARKESATSNQLSSSNVGYRLLRAAGWQEGEGLGVHNQGRVVPLNALKNPGQQGIGFEKKGKPKVVVVQQGAGAAVSGGPAGEGSSGAGGARATKRSKVADIVAAELAGESVEDKVALHRAAMHAEAEAAKGKALQRALFRAFNDPFDNAGAATANTNPLTRKTRLTAVNPLLNSDDDE